MQMERKHVAVLPNSEHPSWPNSDHASVVCSLTGASLRVSVQPFRSTRPPLRHASCACLIRALVSSKLKLALNVSFKR